MGARALTGPAVRGAPSAAPGMVRAAMVIALSSVAATLGLIAIFFVVFPLLVQGLIMFAAAQAMGERAENQDYATRHRSFGS